MGLEFPTCKYRVDSNDRLTWVDAWWLAFARENGGRNLTDVDRILDRSLWDFFADAATTQLYAKVHSHVRRSGNSVVLPVRCDSATMRRQTQLTISLQSSGDLLYEATLLWAKPQGPFPLLDSTRPSSQKQLIMCSCCKRGHLRPYGVHNDWTEVEDLSQRVNLFQEASLPEVSYTVCPECEAALAAACDSAA